MPSSCDIAVEARAPPDVFGRLDDERRRLALVLVGVRLEPAGFRLLERERERRKALVRAEPHEPALPQVDVRPERRRVFRAHAAVDAIARDDDVGAELARCGFVVDDVLLIQKLDAERLATTLQDAQQALASDAAEAMAAGADRPPAEVDVDIVPVIERACDLARRLRSAASRLPSVWSENTTPQPNVSSGRLRSSTRTSCRAPARFSSSARYRPAGPPPMIRTRIEAVANGDARIRMLSV